jgi:hypothetical protein
LVYSTVEDFDIAKPICAEIKLAILSSPYRRRTRMHPILLAIPILLVGAISCAFALDSAQNIRNAKQADLDRKCEAARDVKLAPMRKQIYAECMQKPGRSTYTEDDCKRQAADYNGNRLKGTPLHYDLAECVEAFKYRESYRQSN